MTGLRADAHALASSQTQEAPKALNINTKQTLSGTICSLWRRRSRSGAEAYPQSLLGCPLETLGELLKDTAGVGGGGVWPVELVRAWC